AACLRISGTVRPHAGVEKPVGAVEVDGPYVGQPCEPADGIHRDRGAHVSQLRLGTTHTAVEVVDLTGDLPGVAGGDGQQDGDGPLALRLRGLQRPEVAVAQLRAELGGTCGRRECSERRVRRRMLAALVRLTRRAPLGERVRDRPAVAGEGRRRDGRDTESARGGSGSGENGPHQAVWDVRTVTGGEQGRTARRGWGGAR